MTNLIKNIFIIGVVIAVLDFAIIWILKVMNYINGDLFTQYVKDSMSIIGIIVLASLIIAWVLNAVKPKN